jgi:hypothetical protein
MGFEEIARESNKGRNHQDNYTKTTSLIPKFTQLAAKKQMWETVAQRPDLTAEQREQLSIHH